MNGKFFVPPSRDGSNFKEVFKRLAAAGAGRPLDTDGIPSGPWTPDLLADAISEIDANRSGVDLRTVQLWFQDNDNGVSADNIRWLARVFGCGDPEAISEWQAELSAAQSRLRASRRAKKQAKSSDTTSEVGFNLARKSEALFQGGSSLNLPIVVFVGAVTLGFLAYMIGVQ